MSHHLLRLPAVVERVGLKRAAIYNHIEAGLLPRPVKLGRVSAWPSEEIARIVNARIAGKSDADIRELVRVLVSARKNAED